jgi:prepilin-type processing-associated H-X9-DG protein
VKAGKAMAIRITSLSTPSLESFNDVNNQSRWDQVFAAVNDQVLWNGNMWHTYFTLPASAPAGTYTAETAIAYDRHGTAANYLFIDGHVESQAIQSHLIQSHLIQAQLIQAQLIQETFDPAAGRNRWNPSLAQ